MVMNNNDSGSGSLRDAIMNAALGDTIGFSPSLSGQTITVASPLTISQNLRIIGLGANNLTISGGGTSQVFNISSGTVSLSDMTIANGAEDNKGGGGIQNSGTMTVSNCTLSDNSVLVNAVSGGGGIANFGTMTVSNCTLSGNSFSAGAFGGGGGGIENGFEGTMTVSNCTLSGNSANLDGGGIDNAGTMTVSNCTLSGNSVSGTGGGLESDGGTLTVSNCTLSGNSASGPLGTGGGLESDGGTVTVSNCTVSGNSAPKGGGINNNLLLAGAAIIRDTILAGNTASTGPDFSGALTSDLGHNLIGNTSGGSGFTGPGDLLNVNPLLGPLQDNGGPTLTMSLLPGSPAITAGDPTFPPTTDQRGFSRIVNGSIDIGAFEVQQYVVNNAADSGVGTLRAAVMNADLAGGSVISLSVSGTINLASPLPDIFRSVQVLGSGSPITVQRSTAPGTPDFRIFTVDAQTATILDLEVTISNLTIVNGLVSGTNGGGILNSANLTIINCTLTGNSASLGSGGGIYNASLLAIRNSTLAGNSASFSGGALFNGGGTGLFNSTLAGNSASIGGGIEIFSGQVAPLDTIIAGNTATTSGPDLSGAITSFGHNLIGNASGSSGFVASDLLNYNPLLGVLQNNGGPTPTMALLPGSPAIDAGDNFNALATDQRGFPRIVNGIIDIGAFESRGFTLTVVSGNNQQATVNTAFASLLVVGVTSSFGDPVQGGIVTFSAPASGASATFNSKTATINALGQASVAATANTTAGSYSVTVSASGATGTSFSLTNVAGMVTHFVILGPSSVAHGTSFSITVEAEDAYGNIATGYRGTVGFSASGPANLPSNYTFKASDNGVHAFTGLVLKKKGMPTITVFDIANKNDQGSLAIDVT
jgi:hypothetical protein